MTDMDMTAKIKLEPQGRTNKSELTKSSWKWKWAVIEC